MPLRNEKVRSILRIIVVLFLGVVINSCKEQVANPQQNYIFDAARYSWTIDTTPGNLIYNGWFYDTNNVFLLDESGGMVSYDGISFHNHNYPIAFAAYTISGIDGNNVYIAGYEAVTNNLHMAALLKWNGSSFAVFSPPLSDSCKNFATILCRSSNEIWLSSPSGKIYKFDGTNFQGYNIETYYTFIDPFMVDVSNNLYFMGRVYYGFTGVDSSLIELHEFNNQNWVKIYSQMLYGGDTYYITQNIGTDLCAIKDEDILKYNGSSFTPVMTIKEFLLYDARLTGPSFANLSCAGYDYPSRNDYIFNWNGTKWSKEIQTKESSNRRVIYSDPQKVYAITYDYMSKTVLLKGRKLSIK